MIINCPSCSRRLELPAEAMGRELKCPGCQRTFTAQETREQGGTVLSVRAEGGPPVEATADGGWRIGDRVLAPWEPHWLYPGRVAGVERQTVLVHYDDGDQAWVHAAEVRALDIGPGDRVHGRWKGGAFYYPGTVTERRGEEVHIHYDDGDQEWNRIAQLRVPAWPESAPPPARTRTRTRVAHASDTNNSTWIWLVCGGIVLFFLLRGCA